MTIPALPAFFDMIYSNTKDGKLATDGYLYNDQMFQTLNVIVFLLNSMVTSLIVRDGTSNDGTIVNQGVKFPPYTTAQIVDLEPDAANGTVWFNTTLAKLQLKTAAGVIETITSV